MRKKCVAGLSMVAAFLFLISGMQSKADTIYTNLGPGHAFDTTQGSVLGHSSNGNTYVYGLTFVPTETATPTDVLLGIGLLSAPQLPPLNVYIESNVGGQPGTILDSFTPAGDVSFQPSLVQFDCSSCSTLQAGTTYWIVAQESNPAVNIAWYYTGTPNNPGGTAPAVLNKTGSATGPWVSNISFVSAFQVDGAPSMSSVPEPPSALLLASGMLGLALVGFKKFA